MLRLTVRILGLVFLRACSY